MDDLDLKYNRHTVNKIGSCAFNPAVDCDTLQICQTCGWNPVNEIERKKKARERTKREVWIIGSGTYDKRVH